MSIESAKSSDRYKKACEAQDLFHKKIFASGYLPTEEDKVLEEILTKERNDAYLPERWKEGPQTKEEYSRLVGVLKRLAELYYNTDVTHISDKNFDTLEEIALDYELKHPEHLHPDSRSINIGAKLS